MRILLTNDDGIRAGGLSVLREIAAEIGTEIWVVAPETDQSGVSHSLTLHEPLRCHKVEDRVYSVRGTPTDCVIMAVRHLMSGNAPDLILSGVNRGQNTADDVAYSGTIAGAMEGMLLGFRSMALSLAASFNHADRGKINWETPRQLGVGTIRTLLETGWSREAILNINFPDCAADEVRGLRATSQGKRNLGLLHIEDRVDTRGDPYYWLGYKRRKFDPPHGTDLHAIQNGFISVTPLDLSLTHGKTLAMLNRSLDADL